MRIRYTKRSKHDCQQLRACPDGRFAMDGCVLCLDHVCVRVQVRMDSGVEFDSVRIARMSGMWR